MVSSAITKSRSSALVTLQEIEEWAASGQDTTRILTNIACLIGNRLECDACSIYRLDEKCGSLVLAATIGLRQDCVGQLTMNVTEGLTGLVVEEQRSIEIAARAPTHPRYKYFPEAGEEPYQTFFGVPIVDQNATVGVLVAQTVEPRYFSAGEVHMLSSTGRRLGTLLSRRSRELEEGENP